MSLDLTKLPELYLEKYGAEKVAEIVGQTKSVVAMWVSKRAFPLTAVQAMIEHDPDPIHAIKPLYTNPAGGTKLAILVPLIGPPEPKMMDSLVRLYDRKEMGYYRFAFNCLSVTRNSLAARALRAGYEWFFWMDGDSMLPAGDAAWFKREAELPNMPDVFAGLNTIYRLLVHEKKIVSCCYVGRSEAAPVQFGGGEAMRQEIRRGPRDKVVDVPWTGFGGILTHRSVFDDIIKTQGDEIRMKPGGVGTRFGYEYGFFNPLNGETPGDDVPFCSRAAKAGHKIYVDLAVQCAHIGDRAYTYADL